MNRIILIIVFLLCSGCSSDREVVSLISLLANPSQYDGEEVVVRGYFVHEHEQIALFIGSEHANAHLSEYGLWVSTSEITKFREQKNDGYQYHSSGKTLSGRFAMISGQFRAGSGGHM